MIQISFRTQDRNFETGKIQNSRQISQLIHDPLFSESANPLDLPQKNIIRALFKVNSVDPMTYSPHSMSAVQLQIVLYLDLKE